MSPAAEAPPYELKLIYLVETLAEIFPEHGEDLNSVSKKYTVPI